MNVVSIKIEHNMMDGLKVYQSNEFKMNERLKRYWNDTTEFKSFDEYKTSKGLSDYDALVSLTDNENVGKYTRGLELSSKVFKGKSDPSQDMETITLQFENEIEAKKIFDKINGFKNSALYSKLELDNNEIKYTYSRLFMNEEDGRIQRSKKESMSFNANYPEINNINKNFLELVQEVHNADNNLLLSASFGSGDVRYFSANESLNLESEEVKALKEKMESITNEVNKKSKSKSLDNRGSHNVGKNMETIADSKMETVTETIMDSKTETAAQTKTDSKMETATESKTLSSFYYTAKMTMERELMMLENNKDTIMKTFNDYMKDDSNMDAIIDRMSKSYKNDYLRDFIIFNISDQIKKTNDELVKKDEVIKSVNSENNKLKNSLETTNKKLDDVLVTTEKATQLAEQLDKELTKQNEINEKLLKQHEENEKIIKSLKEQLKNSDDDYKALVKDTNDLIKIKDKEIEEINKSYHKFVDKHNKDGEERSKKLNAMSEELRVLKDTTKEHNKEIKTKDDKIEELMRKVSDLESNIIGLQATAKAYEVVINSFKREEQSEKKDTKKDTETKEDEKSIKDEFEEFKKSKKKQ